MTIFICVIYVLRYVIIEEINFTFPHLITFLEVTQEMHAYCRKKITKQRTQKQVNSHPTTQR